MIKALTIISATSLLAILTGFLLIGLSIEGIINFPTYVFLTIIDFMVIVVGLGLLLAISLSFLNKPYY